MTTRHTCNDGRGPVFGRRTLGCLRCAELAAGAAPVRWAVAQRGPTVAEIRAHNCNRARCGPVCTHGDW